MKIFAKINSLFKKKKELCSECKTGVDFLKLDEKGSFCPYIELHNGLYCKEYRRIDKER